MTAPTSAPTSYEQALLVAEQLVAARAAGGDPVSTAAAVSERIIATRENTAAWAKKAIRRLWAMVNPYDPKQVEAFTIQAAQLMESAQTAVARMAAAGQAQQLAAMGIPVDAVPSNPVDVRGAAAVVRKGMLILERQSISVGYGEDGDVRVSKKDMTALGVLARPGMVYRYAKSQGASDAVAAGLAAGRIDDLVDNNLMLAQRIAEQEALVQAVDLDTGKTRNGIIVIGYRRVIHPELSRTGTCGMCIAASDRIYNVGMLLPIHAHCWCTIAAVTEDYDPADDLNTIDLAQLYKDAGGTSVAHLKRTRYKVDQHGELGPTLVPKSKYKPRTTKSKVRVGGTALLDDQPAQAEVAKHQLRVMEENLARLRSEGEPEDSSKVKYHEKLIANLRKQAEDDAADGDSGSDDGGNGRGGNPTGFGDPDDDEVRRIAAEAEDHEPEISRGMRAAVRDSGGDLARLGTVLKSPASIAEKLQRLAKRTTANTGVVDDALRYTWVADNESTYWASADALVERFKAAGYRVVNDPAGWRIRGYRGRNVVLQDAGGYQFEVQLHTADSLEAAEEAHRLYELGRRPGTGSSEKKRLRKQQEAIFSAVPWPDGVPKVS